MREHQSSAESTAKRLIGDLLFDISCKGQSFMKTVYPHHMSYDLCRDHVRQILRLILDTSTDPNANIAQLCHVEDAEVPLFHQFLKDLDFFEPTIH